MAMFRYFRKALDFLSWFCNKKWYLWAGFMTAFLAFSAFAIINLSGCRGTASEATQEHKKIRVVASLFPQFDFARQIAGNRAEVDLLLPPGVESHSFDPSPADILRISNSDVFLYTGKEMEPWADKIADSIKANGPEVYNVSHGIDLLKMPCHHGEDSASDGDAHCEEGHHHDHGLDPHIWLDPTLAAKMVDNIATAFCERDPENRDYYQTNAERYKQKLLELDSKFMDMINASRRKAIVFAGRFAHLYFVNRYRLEYISAFKGCSSDSDPSVKRIAKIIDFIRTHSVPVVYYEEFSEPKVAGSITEQTGARALPFYAIHNVTKEQLSRGVTYLDLMYENFENLKQGLN